MSRNLEASIQRHLVTWCKQHENPIYHTVFHVPNGELRDKVTAIRLKKQGVVAGIPDLCIPLPGGQTLWLELKTKKGRLSKVQKKLIDRWAERGHIVRVAYGYDEAVAILEEVGSLNITTVKAVNK